MRLKVLLHEQGQPNTVQGAVALCEQALKDTEAQLTTLMGTPAQQLRSTRPMPNSSATASNGARPAPTSLGDAMLAGLHAARR